jgi:AcrR family transcriptional regulator
VSTTTPPGRRARLAPEARRAQLLDLGVRLLATRSIEELSVEVLAEEGGVSRGLLYHYFGGKHAFHEAVVRRVADELIERTAPPPTGDPVERLLASVDAYVGYVVEHYDSYLSLVKGASSGNPTVRSIHDEVLAAMTDRIFDEDGGETVPDTPGARLMARGWSAMVEEVVLGWTAEPRGITRENLLLSLAASLQHLVDSAP